jgi:hypothetical protein
MPERTPRERIARARGLAEALAGTSDDGRIEGVRQVGAEIAALLGGIPSTLPDREDTAEALALAEGFIDPGEWDECAPFHKERFRSAADAVLSLLGGSVTPKAGESPFPMPDVMTGYPLDADEQSAVDRIVDQRTPRGGGAAA